MGIYYAVQSGLSVGFGLLSERERGGRVWFTIFHGLCGLTFVSAALGLALVAPSGRMEQSLERMLGERRPRLRAAVHRWLPWLALLVLLLIGAAFEMAYNRWSFDKAMFFAFFALSTGGLQPPGTTDAAEMLFIAAYCTVGIPVMAAVVGSSAGQWTAEMLRLHAWAATQEEERAVPQEAATRARTTGMAGTSTPPAQVVVGDCEV